jgi:hypothetical protein
MLGAIGQHLFVLGIIVNNDGGTLFTLAMTTLVCCAIVLAIKRRELQTIYKKNEIG